MRFHMANRVRVTEVEGPYRRAAVWVAGCTIRCPGCCNPELFDAGAGERVSVASVLRWLDVGPPIEGLTVLGGEPLEQLGAVTELCAGARGRGLGTIVFSGLTARVATSQDGFTDLAAQVDTFVLGPYLATAPETRRRFIGSSNQELRHCTGRYADPRLWQGKNRAEIQIDPRGRVSIHGFPTEVTRARVRLGLGAG